MTRLILLFVLIGAHCANAQKYSVTESLVTFYSDAPIEEIRASNKATRAIFDLSSAEFAFSVPITEFQFKKKLMQEHFNEKYMESEKFPSATFQGSVNGLDQSSSEKQDLTAKGQLTIHGVTREVEIPGDLTMSKKGIVITSQFVVKLEDYEIEIPQLLWQNIAEEIEVTVEFELKE